jgi:hypothetical protein
MPWLRRGKNAGQGLTSGQSRNQGQAPEVLEALRAKYLPKMHEPRRTFSGGSRCQGARNGQTHERCIILIHCPRPGGILNCFEVPTKGIGINEEQVTRLAVDASLIRSSGILTCEGFDNTFGRQTIKDSKDGVEVLVDKPIATETALQLAQQRLRAIPSRCRGKHYQPLEVCCLFDHL